MSLRKTLNNMKLTILLLCAFTTQAQIFQPYHKVSLPLQILGGACYYHQEVLRNNYYKFEAVWPEANEQTWNPDYSSNLKYKNNNPAEGPKYFGSTTFLVMFTDPYHAFYTGGKALLIGGGAVMAWGVYRYDINPERPVLYFFKEFLLSSIAYSLGFTLCELTYNQIYKNRL